MDALELVLLLDYYGGMLTDKQKECFDMRYNRTVRSMIFRSSCSSAFSLPSASIRP